MIKIVFFLSTIYIASAQAYLDPGTGSMLLSTLIALIATFIYSIKSFAFNIKSLVFRVLGRKIQKIQKIDIVIYNEGEQYFSLFYPILKELQGRGISFTYLYSDINDSIVQKIDNIDAHFIDEGNKAFFQLNTLEAKMCIMTTPGLDVLQIKRSKGVKHYCHITHSTGGCIGYEVFGTDYFDSILAPNKYDKKFIEELELKRQLPQKDISIIGTPYLDYLLKKLEKIKPEKNSDTTILVSPTWGENGLLSKYGFPLFEQLLKKKEFKIIVRPHPQSVKYEKYLLKRLKNTFSDNSNLEWDYKKDGLESMTKASIMISDYSGIVLDFMFLFSKPVITIPSVIDFRGKDYIMINDIPWYVDFFQKHTYTLKEEHVKNINSIVSESLQNYIPENKFYDDSYNPYFGTSAIKAVNAIENIYQKIEETK